MCTPATLHDHHEEDDGPEDGETERDRGHGGVLPSTAAAGKAEWCAGDLVSTAIGTDEDNPETGDRCPLI